MRWGVFIVFTLLTLVIDTTLQGALEIGGIVPSFAAVLAAFVALSAPPLSAMWAGLILGILMDLSTPHVIGADRPFHLIGPHALGYLFAVNVVLPLRTMVFRRNPLTLGVFAGLTVLAAGLVSILIWSIRGWYADTPVLFGGGSASGELLATLLRAAYTALVGIPVGWLLVRTAPAWGFGAGAHRFNRR